MNANENTAAAAQVQGVGEVPALIETQREAVRDALSAALGDAMDCTRTWKAWGIGTMTEDDFELVADNDERLEELTAAVEKAIAAAPAAPLPAQPEQIQPQQSGSIRPSAEPAWQHEASDSGWREKVREIATWLNSQCQQQQISPEEWCYPTQFDYDLAQAASELFAVASKDEQTSSAACGGCSPSSPVAGAAPLPELTGPILTDKEKQQRQTVQMMADCMDMVRTDLIEIGIIDKSVAPMFIPEAVANYCKNLAASPSPALAQQQEPSIDAAIERAAVICESFCASDDNEEDINFILCQRAQRIRGFKSVETAAPGASIRDDKDFEIQLGRYVIALKSGSIIKIDIARDALVAFLDKRVGASTEDKQ